MLPKKESFLKTAVFFCFLMAGHSLFSTVLFAGIPERKDNLPLLPKGYLIPPENSRDLLLVT